MTTESQEYFDFATDPELRALAEGMSFADLLHGYRVNEAVSQGTLAVKLGISRQRLCDYEKGRYIPAASKAVAMAETLGYHPGYVLGLVLQDHLRREGFDYKVSVA